MANKSSKIRSRRGFTTNNVASDLLDIYESQYPPVVTNQYSQKSYLPFKRASYQPVLKIQKSKTSYLPKNRVDPLDIYAKNEVLPKNTTEAIRSKICSERQSRKEVLHSINRTGRGSANKKPTFTWKSKVKC